MIHFKEISKDNLWKVCALKVFDHQEDQVATNLESIAEGNYNEHAWFRALYDGELPVGFVMLSLKKKENIFWVWRFMIDKNHQGKGYGKAAMNLIKEFIKEEFPTAKEVFLSYVPKEEGGADAFYKKVGFEETGKIDGGEKEMRFSY